MKVTKYIKPLIKRFRKTFVRTKYDALRFVLRSSGSKHIQKYLKMEAGMLLRLLLRLFRYQLAIRPRIRLSGAFLLALIFVFGLSSYLAGYVHAKEKDIKINGHQVIVAVPLMPNVNRDADIQVSGTVIPKVSSFSYTNPVDHGYVSQGFSFYHKAYDFATDLGTPIHPIGSGVVEFGGFLADGHGNTVIVDHGDGMKTLYAHMGKIDVGVGNMVNPSVELGTVGLTGRTTGPHVHLEVKDHGANTDPGAVLPSQNLGQRF